MPRITRIATAVAVLLAASVAMTGCVAGTSAQASRAELYSSLAELVADSAAVVDVEVQSQEILDEDGTYTLSTVTVVSSFEPAGLASPSAVAPADELVVRQIGSASGPQSSEAATLLEVGEQYLLFLTPTMLDGDAGAQFYVVGVSAGIYRSEDGRYVRMQSDDGDVLPDTLTAADLTG